jgi:capsular polysaccharide biosynthesis protein
VTEPALSDAAIAELARLALSEPGQPNLHLLSLVKQALAAKLPLQEAANAFGALCGRAFDVRTLPVAGMRDFLHSTGFHFQEVVQPPKTFLIREPPLLGESKRGSVEAVGRRIFVGVADDAVVRHRSALVETGGVLLLDVQDDEADAIRVAFEYDPHVLHGNNSTISLLDAPAEDIPHLPEAIHLGGATSYAFGHWLGEYLIKFFGALRAGILPRVPILIDAGMPSSHREALLLFLAGEDFPIIEIDPGSTVTVDRLWVLSSWMYAPYFPLPGQDLGPKRLSPPPQAFADLLRWMRHRVSLPEGETSKLFLRRRPHQHRRMINANLIESAAADLGFSLHDPGEYDFAGQLRLVEAAPAIAGPDGSALLLSFFARAGAKITILNHSYLEAVAALTTILEELGHDVLLVQGAVVRQDQDYVRFSDYEVSETDLRAALSR